MHGPRGEEGYYFKNINVSETTKCFYVINIL
jgi:hypothetical protein